MTKVIIKKCGYRGIEEGADLIVAEIDTEMRPLHGAGESIWKGAGIEKKDLQVDGTLKGGEVLMTPAAGALDDLYTGILHATLPSVESMPRSEIINVLRILYRSILERAVATKSKRIAIPLLGIMSLKIPQQDGVEVALTSIRDFISETKESGLEVIIIFTNGPAYKLVTSHSIYQSMLKGIKVKKNVTEECRSCIIDQLRNSNEQRELSVLSVPCRGELHRMSSMIPDDAIAFINRSSGSFFGASHEADLIMARLGEFNVDWSTEESRNIEICSTHLDRLSRDWQNSFFRNVKYRENAHSVTILCSFPEHRGARGAPLPGLKSNSEKVQKSDAIRWMRKKGTIIQLGIPICDADCEYLRSSEFDEQAASQETREMETMMEIDDSNDVDSLTEQMDNVPPITKKTPSTAKKEVKEAVANFLDALGRGGVERKKNWVDLSERHKRTKIATVDIAIDAFCEVLAPDNKEELKELATKGRRKQEIDPWQPLKKHLSEVADIYDRTTSRSHRLFILSTVASLQLTVLQQFFPDLTKYMHDKARRLVCNPVIDTEIRRKERFAQPKLDRLIGFLLSPNVVINLPFNERTVRLDDGTVSHLPNFMRLQTIEEVYRLYREFLIEREEKEFLVKETSAKAIIKLVAPTRRKNLTCVDEKIGEAMKAFDEMFGMVNELVLKGFIVKDTGLGLTRMLQHAKSYLRGDYKVHIKQFSSCADHCAAFALSDPNEEKLAIDCSKAGVNAHSHDTLCQRCEDVNVSINRLREAFETAEDTTIDPSEREHFHNRCEEIDICKNVIQEMKRHQMRAAVSHGERAEFVEKLKPGVALVTLDWAQKFEPLHAREKQSDYYAKCGISYHISHALTIIDGEHAEHYSVHIAGVSVPQDGCAVSHITESFLRELKAMGIASCIIRSDNAGCYRNGPLISFLISMQKRVGIEIQGILYSEAQAGKSACDRGSAILKTKARDVVASHRTKVDTKEALFKVLTTGRLLQGISIHLCTISGVKTESKTIPNITSYSSLTFEGSSIRLRRHRSIGDGILFPISKLQPCEGKMTINESGGYTVDCGEKFWLTRSSVEKKEPELAPIPDSPSVSRLIPCPDETCTQEFMSFRELDKHILRGKHALKLERKTMHDYCAEKIAESLDTTFSLEAAKLKVAIQNSLHNGLTELDEGWALRKTRLRNFDDEPARDIIRAYFRKMRAAKKKCNPHDAETHMKTKRKPDGSLEISPRNRLNISQIKSLINGMLGKESAETPEETKKVTSNGVMGAVIEEEYNPDDFDDTDDEQELNDLVKKSGIFLMDDGDTEDEPLPRSDNGPLAKLRKRN